MKCIELKNKPQANQRVRKWASLQPNYKGAETNKIH